MERGADTDGVDISGETTKAVERSTERRSSKAPSCDFKSAGKAPLEALRRACSNRGVELSLSNSTSYKIG